MDECLGLFIDVDNMDSFHEDHMIYAFFKSNTSFILERFGAEYSPVICHKKERKLRSLQQFIQLSRSQIK